MILTLRIRSISDAPRTFILLATVKPPAPENQFSNGDTIVTIWGKPILVRRFVSEKPIEPGASATLLFPWDFARPPNEVDWSPDPNHVGAFLIESFLWGDDQHELMKKPGIF